MKLNYFRYLFNRVNSFWLTDTHILMRKPCELYDTESDKSIKFKSIEQALEYNLDGRLIKDIIIDMSELRLSTIDGRGSSKGNEGTFKFSHAGAGDGEDQTHDLFSAYANTQIKTKTFDAALKQFSDKYKTADREYGYVVDDQGFVHTYRAGNPSSIGIWGSESSQMVLHNHPSGGAFSDSDLISVSQSREGGIVAAGNKYNYIFRKGTHFKSNEFIKAVKRARMKGKDYDDAVHKWLTAHAKKYGYSYERQKV